MTTKTRYWLIYIITAFIVLLIVMSIFWLFWSDLLLEERLFVTRLAPKLAIYTIAAIITNMLLFASLLRHLFTMYIDPIVTLTEETELITLANAKYRIVPDGADEVVGLTHAINDLADQHITLKTDVQQIVQRSKSDLDDEKRQLETLMSQIPEGVIVCNIDGRILLYNHPAQEITNVGGQVAERSANNRKTGFLGLGRSIFGVLDRNPIVYALNYLQNRLNNGELYPTFNFITTKGRERFIRVRMAAVAGVAKQAATIDGYVLTVSDITHQMQADSRRDIFLQSLTIGLQTELGVIGDAVTALQIPPPQQPPPGTEESSGSSKYLSRIKGSVDALLEQIDAVANQHARRLQDPGESEHILGIDLMNVLHETLVDKFNVEVLSSVEDNLWLNINSYTVVRGVNYLMGQLTNHLEISKVELKLNKDGDAGYLSLHWFGDPVKVETIGEWKQCPLMTQAKARGPISLSNLLTGRGEILSESDGEKEAVSVRFKLTVETPESKWSQQITKEHRPVYYEFDLFKTGTSSPELDDVYLEQLPFVVFDTETTGLDPSGGDKIISIGAIRVVNGKLRREEFFDQLIDPRRSIPLESLRIHEIYPEMLSGMPIIDEVLPKFHKFVEGAVLVAHNAAFDMKFIQLQAQVEFSNPILDTLLLSAVVHPCQELHNLDDILERLGLAVVGRHTALGDAIMTAEVLLKLIPLLKAKRINTLREAREACRNTQFANIAF